jgi:hypothetical protein
MVVPHLQISGFQVAGERGCVEERSGLAVASELGADTGKLRAIAYEVQRTSFVFFEGIRDELRQAGSAQQTAGNA